VATPNATVRVFAPDHWGELERFVHLYGETFALGRMEARAVTGTLNHFRKALTLARLAKKLKPNLAMDREQLEQHGYTPAENSRELSAVIEEVYTELYSSIDCATTVIFALHSRCRGLPKSTRGMFQRVRDGKVGPDFPAPLRDALKDADWFDKLRSIRDELTHSDIGNCHLEKDGTTVHYMHSGLHTAGRSLIIDDAFHDVDFLLDAVNRFHGKVFQYLNAQLH